mmetsp:Transcript_11429/g.15863  ORF Transcript_11429/g.15863 Transcript_11429/m.15863 type:complete len:383 (-) Transcript_11429:2342-3490(-)
MQNTDIYEPFSSWSPTGASNQNHPVTALQFTNSLSLSRTFHQYVLGLQTIHNPGKSVPAFAQDNLQNELSNAEELLRKKSEESIEEPLFIASRPAPLRFDVGANTCDFPRFSNASSQQFLPPSLPTLPSQTIDSQAAALCAVAEIVREELVDFRCLWENCSESFKTRTGLATHCSTHLKRYIEQMGAQHEHSSFTCKWNCCNAHFSDVKKLAKHMAEESHVGQTPFLPKIEGKRQPQLVDDKGKKKKMYMCSFPGCGKVFGDSSNRKKHERTHDSNRERFHCSEPGCNRSYSTKTDLNIHLKVHKGEYPHKCTHPNCTKAFVRLSELYAHERTHDGIMPHVCSVCKKAFREKSRLKSHEELHKTQICKAPDVLASADFTLQM